jgi:HSP20 family protein
MAVRKRHEDFAEGKRRLDEIGRRLGALFGTPKAEARGGGGLWSGLGSLIEQLGKLVDQAEEAGGEIRRTGEFGGGAGKGLKGVYGFSVKVGMGEKGAKVEPFGNIRTDEESGRVVVRETREPMVDIFDEPDHVLVVAEVPGITDEDVRVELHGDVLTLSAERGDKKYGKELLLPASFPPDAMRVTCRNGVLEVRLEKGRAG